MTNCCKNNQLFEHNVVRKTFGHSFSINKIQFCKWIFVIYNWPTKKNTPLCSIIMANEMKMAPFNISYTSFKKQSNSNFIARVFCWSHFAWCCLTLRRFLICRCLATWASSQLLTLSAATYYLLHIDEVLYQDAVIPLISSCQGEIDSVRHR